MEGHIYVRGDIGQDFSKGIEKQLQANANATSLTLHISSRGGSVYEGYTTYHLLNEWKKQTGGTIHAVVEGQAQSMATFIALAGDNITMLDPSVWMIHNPSQGVEGDAAALKGGSDELLMIQNEMAQAYSDKTKIPVDKILEMMRATTTLNAKKAKEMGFVNEVKNKLTAVAFGEDMEKGTPNLFNYTVAMDIKTKDGKMLSIDSTDGEFVNKKITVDGAPAEGTFMLEDGRSLIAVAGVVTSVDAMVPVETADQKLAKVTAELNALKAKQTETTQAAVTTTPTVEEQLAAAQKELSAMKETINTSTAKVEEVKVELEKTITALAEQKKKTTIGDKSKPTEGMTPNRMPVGFKPSAPNAVALDLTRAFINEHLTWLKPYYDEGFFTNAPSMISILETNFNYTYPGILTTDIYYKPTLDSPALSDIFTIDQDIKFRKQYNLVTELNKIVLPYTGCGGTPAGNRQLITNATVNTKEFQMYEGWCKDDFTQQLTGIYNNLAQEWLKTGLDSFDPAGTPIDKIIMTVLKDALRRDIFRRVSFAAGNSADPDYNQIDGLWDRLIDSSGGSNYCVIRAGSALGTGTLAAGAALTALEAVYAASTTLLKNQPNKVFWVTRSVWDNYYNSLINTGSGYTELAYTNLQKGIDTLTYKGIPVRNVDLWDAHLAETDNPLFAVTRNLILLTVKNNHILGVESGSDLNRIDSWYENKDQKRYYRSNFKLGYNYLHCDLQTIAY